MVLTRGDYSVICFLLICIGLSVTKGDPRPGEIVLCTAGKLPSLLSKCTHVLFAYMGDDNFLNTDQKLNIEDKLRMLVAEKKEKPDLKILFQITNWNPRDTLKSSDIFAKNLTQFLLTNNLDGLVYGALLEGPTGEIVKKLKEAMSDHNLLLLYSLEHLFLENHKITEIREIIDHIIVHNVDNWSDSDTIPPNPLRSKDTTISSIDGIVKYILDRGVLPSKVLIPLSFKGKIYSLLEKSKGVFGEEGKFEMDLWYPDICPIIKNGTRYWDEESQTPLLALDKPFCYRKGECIGPYSVVSYEDSESLAKKVQYGKKLQLGGFFVKSIAHDDNEGKCGEGRQPLMNAAIAEINRPIATGILGQDPTP